MHPKNILYKKNNVTKDMIHIRMPPFLKENLRDAADAFGINMSTFCRLILQSAMDGGFKMQAILKDTPGQDD